MGRVQWARPRDLAHVEASPPKPDKNPSRSKMYAFFRPTMCTNEGRLLLGTVDDCVRVDPTGTHFCLRNNTPWHFCGANCYYLLTRAADASTARDVTRVLDDLAAANINVVRTWAFADGPEQWNALQPDPGVYDERVFRALDRLIVEAARRDIRVLLVLTNYWADYGGMKQYVLWSRQARGVPSDGASASEFYEDPHCQATYAAFVTAIINRVNTVTGEAYRDCPAILGWAPANEPQCPEDSGENTKGRAGRIAAWSHRASSLIKRLDPNHLVFMDCEGFLGPSTPVDCERNPYDCSHTGCDFAQDCSSPAIDVACCHLYPDLWLPNAEPDRHLSFALAWLDCHVALAAKLGKPLVLSEFGKKNPNRGSYFKALLNACLNLMKAGRPLGGSMFWMAAAPSYPDYDGFTVYFSELEPGKPSRKAQGIGVDDTAIVIAEHAAKLQALNDPTVTGNDIGPRSLVERRVSSSFGREKDDKTSSEEKPKSLPEPGDGFHSCVRCPCCRVV